MSRICNAVAFLAIVLALAPGAACKHEGRRRSNSGVTAGFRDSGERLSGGDTTVFDTSNDAFGFPAANLATERQDDFFVGNSFFRSNWVAAPASTEGRDGLGPLFNARSCSACHLRDGRGRPPVDPDEQPRALLFKLVARGTTEPDPTYGDQFQNFSILGVPEEGKVAIDYVEKSGEYADGRPYSLRSPSYSVVEPRYGPLAAETVLAPIIAPAIVGLGLLEAIDETTVLAFADPSDADNDGISGRPNYVPDARGGELALGRFGWKATQPSVEQQSAGAFNGDMGLTTPLFVEQNCTRAQQPCLDAPGGGAPEVSEEILGLVSFYARTLAVPGRRVPDDPVVRRGRRLFFDIGCASCHTPKVTTSSFPSIPELAFQTIRPYTDLLLHDMGDGLADGRVAFEASGSEWRTPPLWGIGLVQTVNGHTFFLHDGRARSLEEAILWHDGEADAAREGFRTADAADRDALIRFLEDL